MLTALVLVSLVGWTVLLAAGIAFLVDGFDRRRLRRVAAQVRVTEAVHGAVGAIVAPTVAKHPGRPWTVTMGLRPRDLGVAGRLAEIACQSLGADGRSLRIVFVPRRD